MKISTLVAAIGAVFAVATTSAEALPVTAPVGVAPIVSEAGVRVYIGGGYYGHRRARHRHYGHRRYVHRHRHCHRYRHRHGHGRAHWHRKCHGHRHRHGHH